MTGPHSLAPPRLTVAIPTFRRPERLRALLEALPERFAECTGVDIDVLVIDNDLDRSGAPATVDTGLPLRCVHEPTPGIAAARNRALDECRDSDLIAFIDDDELPRPQWLSSLVATWRQYGSSAVMGRVISVFDHDADPWVLATGTFRRIPRPTGTPLEVAAAGNLLLDLVQVRRLGVRFDESLGLAGGEDTLFSRQLVGRGGTIVYCAESETEDFVIADRLTRDWATQRAYSSANAWSLARLRMADGKLQRLALRTRMVPGGALRIGAGAARHLYGRLSQRLDHDARGVRTHFRGRGMVAAALGRRYEEYSRGPVEGS
ncbi:glycosyltransferase family 2 protein [Brachybacterium sp. AOP29-B2-41]|uniref:glycosyltransferase family 2 protein n=1 Tax=Brachybacterium sp. AOP29-B2-41 TaxID=3457704 RepID=UPI004034A5FF